jgi:hypothetical protein
MWGKMIDTRTLELTIGGSKEKGIYIQIENRLFSEEQEEIG